MEVETIKPSGVSIFCPLCASPFIPAETKTNMCLQCITAQGNITQGITKEAIVNQCRNCRRYQRPPWVYCERESKELLALCLRKIRGLNSVKIIDANFIYTEPHSRRIKIKLTIQKEISKNIEIQESFIVEFTEHWQQCEDCQKEFTPHTWGAVVQLRQHIPHKKTLFFLEQIILKHNAHEKCVKVQEEDHGMDFFFKNRQHANHLVDFLESLIPCQIKNSKQLLSTDEQNGTQSFKFSYSITIPKVCKDDLVITTNHIRKQMGASTELLLCLKVNQMIKFLDPHSLNIYEITAKKYFEYEQDLKIIPFHNYKSEFQILNTEADQYKRDHNTSQQTLSHKSVFVDVCRTSDFEQFQIRSHLGDVLKSGDEFLGFDLDKLTIEELDTIKHRPEAILIRKRREAKKRIYTLKRMDIEKLEKKKPKENQEPMFEEFLEQLDTDKDMRSSVNLYKDAKVVEEKKSQALLKKIDKKNQKEKEQEKKLRIKRQFEELKNEKKTIKEDDNEEDWEDEDGIRLNELINNLKLEDDLDNHVNVDQRQVEDFLSELDKIKISK